MKLHDFLVEHAKFPFPHPDELKSMGTTDISEFEVGLFEQQWRAGRAVRDDTLIQKLCHSLENILGDTPLEKGAENYLLSSYSPRLQVDERGRENRKWDKNPSEAQASFQTNSRFSFMAEQFGLTLAQSRSL